MKEDIKKFIIGAFIVTLATTAGYIISPIEVRFLTTLTDNPALIGATFGIGTLFFAIFSLWLGRLSDRIGRNKFVIIGCGLGILYPLLYASTYNIFQYMGIRFAWAFSAVATGPIFTAYLHDILKGVKRKGHYFGIFYSVQSITGAGAAFLGGYLSDKYSLLAPYFAMSFIFILATVISLTQLGFKNQKNQTYEKRHIFFGIKYVFTRPALIFYFFQNTAFSLNWGIKAMLWPLIIFGMAGSDTVTGSVFATMGVVAFIMLLFIGKYVDKKGAFHSAKLSMFILGASGLVLALTDNLYLFWIFAAIYAIGESINGPAQAVLLIDHVESKYRGEILGLDAVFDNIFGTLSPFFAGLLLTLWLPQKILLIYIGVFWLALIMSNVLHRMKLRNFT